MGPITGGDTTSPWHPLRAMLGFMRFVSARYKTISARDKSIPARDPPSKPAPAPPAPQNVRKPYYLLRFSKPASQARPGQARPGRPAEKWRGDVRTVYYLIRISEVMSAKPIICYVSERRCPQTLLFAMFQFYHPVRRGGTGSPNHPQSILFATFQRGRSANYII